MNSDRLSGGESWCPAIRKAGPYARKRASSSRQVPRCLVRSVTPRRVHDSASEPNRNSTACCLWLAEPARACKIADVANKGAHIPRKSATPLTRRRQRLYAASRIDPHFGAGASSIAEFSIHLIASWQ